ncbi:MAG: exodeoxyribonuclease V subunit gamma [Eubacteriales bacterium]|nr:exodeoxyribonuclease V subunit gamma [Eubacteriales bacterium]MDD3880780.1 exodeoxyribonuclease V subunit gamma [Eubacteriales bacterium]MDD4511853.1 exodeoxyribonuclease V subunit gamma [Eubacteriales bacterium]
MNKLLLGYARTLLSETLIRAAEDYNNNRNVTILVPEQFTLRAEFELMNALKTSGFFRAQVLSPTRLRSRVFAEAGFGSGKSVSPAGQAMALSLALHTVADKLVYYKKIAERSGFSRELSTLLSSLRASRVTPEALSEEAEKLPQGSLKHKTADLAVILEEYERILSEKYLDAVSVERRLIERLAESEALKRENVYVYGFDIFTETMQELLLAISRECESLSISVVCPAASADSALYLPVRKSVGRLLELFAQSGIGIETENLPKPEGKSALSHLEEYVLSSRAIQFPDSENVKLYACQNPYTEVQRAAESIAERRLAGTEYREMALICPDIAPYAPLITSVFSMYGIPVFLSVSSPAASHPLSRFLLSAVKCACLHIKTQHVLAMIKSGFSPLTEREGWEIENYALKTGVRDYGWTRPFIKGDTPQETAAAEAIRLKLIAPLLRLADGIRAEKTGDGAAKAIFAFLEESRVYPRLSEQETELSRLNLNTEAALQRQVWKLIMDALEQLHALIGEKPITLKWLAPFLSSAMEESELSGLPPTDGGVICGNLGNLMTGRIKELYMLGLQDGMFSVSQSGLLSEGEKHTLESDLKVFISDDTPEHMLLSYLDFKKALSACDGTVYLMYSGSSGNGEEKRPSQVIYQAQELLPQLSPTPEGTKPPSAPLPALRLCAQEIRKYMDSGEMPPLRVLEAMRFFRESEEWSGQLRSIMGLAQADLQAQNLSENTAAELYAGREFSISRLENYAKCPFKYFAESGLRARERKEYEVTRADSGQMEHDALERYLTTAQARENWPNLSDEEIKALMKEALELTLEGQKLGAIYDSKRSMAEIDRLTRVLERAAAELTREAQKSRFRFKCAETEFGPGRAIPPLMLRLENGEEALLRGRIDRIDSLDSGGTEYLRIIDYKSGKTVLDIDAIEDGRQLQLYLYLLSALQNDKTAPAGAAYVYLDDPFVELSTMDDAEIEKQIKKKLQSSGVFIKDAELMREMGQDVKGGSDTLKSTMRVLYLEKNEMNSLLEKVKSKAQQLSSAILSGKIPIAPFRSGDRTACDNCPYRSVCRFGDGKTLQYRKNHRLKKEDFLASLSNI